MKRQVVMALIAGGSLAGLVLLAQAPPAKVFEVAAIRAASLPTPATVQSGQFRAGSKINGERVDFAFISLADLLPYAFRVKSFQVSGPPWMRESRWNILATIPDGASEADVPEMMQALLIERFKLKVHREKREQPVYELVVVKGGPKMEAAAGDDGSGAPESNNLPLPDGFPLPPPGGPGGRGPDGGPNQDGRGGRGGPMFPGLRVGGVRMFPGDNCRMRLEFDKLTMPSLADTLTPFLDRPVVDETGLKGSYKAALNLPMEVMFGMMQNMARTAGLPMPGPGGRGDGPPPGGRGFAGCDPAAALSAGADSSNAGLFQAVQQLGLKLQPRKAPFDTVIVYNLERNPSEN